MSTCLNFNQLVAINTLLKENKINYIIHNHSGCYVTGGYFKKLGRKQNMDKILQLINAYLSKDHLELELIDYDALHFIVKYK